MPATRYHTRERAAQQADFLRALSMGKTVTAAAADTGLHERTYYRLRRTDPAFAVRWQTALDRQEARTQQTSEIETTHFSCDPLELEAQRRAVRRRSGRHSRRQTPSDRGPDP